MRVAVGQRALDLGRAGASAQQSAPRMSSSTVAGSGITAMRSIIAASRAGPHGPRALSFSAVGPKFAPVSPARSSFAPRAGAATASLRASSTRARRLRRPRHRGARGRSREREGGVRAQRRLALLPASNKKLAVTYAALVALGPSFRMRTEVLGDGQLRDGVVWVGDLVLKGYGDPLLDDAGLATLARDLRATGSGA